MFKAVWSNATSPLTPGTLWPMSIQVEMEHSALKLVLVEVMCQQHRQTYLWWREWTSSLTTHPHTEGSVIPHYPHWPVHVQQNWNSPSIPRDWLRRFTPHSPFPHSPSSHCSPTLPCMEEYLVLHCPSLIIPHCHYITCSFSSSLQCYFPKFILCQTILNLSSFSSYTIHDVAPSRSLRKNRAGLGCAHSATGSSTSWPTAISKDVWQLLLHGISQHCCPARHCSQTLIVLPIHSQLCGQILL